MYQVRLTCSIKIRFLLLLASIFSFGDVFSQASVVSINHNADNQAQVTIVFNGAVTMFGPTDWTAQFNPGGIPVAVMNSVSVGNTAIVTLATAVGIGQTIQVGWAGGFGATAFGFINSVNNRTIVCTDFNFAALIGNTPPCAPVSP
ncbi:MAG: hypothetical protein JJE09_11290, partial [Bacteroidia bacterium]|nr:hypothetical protein [Bacteroidia bacterium]